MLHNLRLSYLNLMICLLDRLAAMFDLLLGKLAAKPTSTAQSPHWVEFVTDIKVIDHCPAAEPETRYFIFESLRIVLSIQPPRPTIIMTYLEVLQDKDSTIFRSNLKSIEKFHPSWPESSNHIPHISGL